MSVLQLRHGDFFLNDERVHTTDVWDRIHKQDLCVYVVIGIIHAFEEGGVWGWRRHTPYACNEERLWLHRGCKGLGKNRMVWDEDLQARTIESLGWRSIGIATCQLAWLNEGSRGDHRSENNWFWRILHEEPPRENHVLSNMRNMRRKSSIDPRKNHVVRSIPWLKNRELVWLELHWWKIICSLMSVQHIDMLWLTSGGTMRMKPWVSPVALWRIVVVNIIIVIINYQ